MKQNYSIEWENEPRESRTMEAYYTCAWSKLYREQLDMCVLRKHHIPATASDSDKEEKYEIWLRVEKTEEETKIIRFQMPSSIPPV